MMQISRKVQQQRTVMSAGPMISYLAVGSPISVLNAITTKPTGDSTHFSTTKTKNMKSTPRLRVPIDLYKVAYYAHA